MKTFTEEQIKHLEEVGNWFKNLPDIKLKFFINENKTLYDHLSGAPVCHCGLLNLFYKNGKTYWEDGAKELLENLGFESRHELEIYFRDNADLWGNENGRQMFNWYSAYNEGDKEYTNENLDTKSIGNKLLAVAGRIREKQGI